MHFSTIIALALTLSSTTLAVPLLDRRQAVSFASVDITRQPGDGAAALTAAGAICRNTDSPASLEAKRRAAEDAETGLFNPAIAAAGDAATRAAIQCQKDRNKVFKNHCQLVKAQLQNDAAQIAENTKQVDKNTADVTTRCANVDTSRFIGSNGGAVGAPAPKAPAPKAPAPKAAAPKAAAPKAPAPKAPAPKAGAISFASIDISKSGGNGAAALAAASSVCPNTDSPATLEAKRRVAEDAEKTRFNPAIAAAGNAATKAAIQCQKDRNKVLKNHCQLVKAQLQNDAAQIAENTKQLNKNTGDVTTKCAGVNTALFI
ncbi:hypothetical protein HDU67_007554 [Dinochytrium kinnereticum]|nr:hypothetical protein HDU67_007554 [Dinochytrium kinnereticum]